MNDLLELDRSQARVQILTINALNRARARFQAGYNVNGVPGSAL